MPRTTPGHPRVEAILALVDATQEGVLIGRLSPTNSGRYGDTTTAANGAVRAIFGFPVDTPETEVVAFAPDRFVDLEARDILIERIRSGVPLSNHFLRMRRLDGSPVWVEVTATGEATDDGGVILQALVRDVSARKERDDRARDVYQQILQSEKMAALGQTISGVAHELNNPLATIVSWAERLSERPLDELARRGVGVIQGEAERAARIVRNLLTVSRNGQTTRSEVSLNAIVRDTIAVRAYDPDGAIRVTLDLDESLPALFVDAHQLQQVVLNLLMNAEQAMRDAHGGGHVTIRTGPGRSTGTVALFVTDDGPGVPSEFQTRIFDPFFTTKDVGKGTGLGLAVVYAIVQDHGGSIRVTSAPGGGALFQVELPAAATSRGQAAVPLPADRLHTARILVVENEPRLARCLIDPLTREGITADLAGDGQEALARLRRATYDAVVCNLKLPKADGRTLYRAITATTPTLARRVIFVTADAADSARFFDETGCRCLVAPFRPEDVLRTVSAALV